MSRVNDSGMANQNLSVGNVLAIIGTSTGGQPNTPLVFGDPSEVDAVLKSGELRDAVKKAFSPSNELGAPSKVIALRVNPAVQSSLTLKDVSSAAVVGLVSLDYGLPTNQIKVKVSAGTTAGLQATAQLGNSYYSQDDIYRNALSLQYSGGQPTATLSVTSSTVTLSAPAGTVVATIDLNVFKTIGQLADRINAVPGFVASVLDGNANKPALNGLDGVTAQDVKAPYIVKAHLQALVDWFNSSAQGYVAATRLPNAVTLPAPIPFTYMTGGSDGIVTNTEWASAFSTLQTLDVQWVAPLSGSGAIAAMADAHVQYMSTIGRMERRASTGTAAGTTDALAMTAAKLLNSDRTSLTHLGYFDYDAAGNLVLFPPYMTAAAVAAGFCGSDPGTPLTNKAFTFRGLERTLRNPTDTDALIQAGVLCFEDTPEGYKCVKSISTWRVDDNYTRVEQSTGVALDFTVRNVRKALDKLRGQKNTPITTGRTVSITESTLKLLAVAEPNGPGVLAGDAQSPPYKNIKAVSVGDAIGVEFQCSPVIPTNYISVTVFAVPYTGSASA